MEHSCTPDNFAQSDDMALRIAKAATENSDLPRQFIENTLIGIDEADAGKASEYR